MQVKAGRKLQALEAFSPRNLIKAEECWSPNSLEKCPLICSFGFNSGGTGQPQHVLFLLPFSGFHLILLPHSTPTPAGVCEFQGQLKVKLYHVGDEMQADVAVLADGGHTPRAVLWTVGDA